MTVLGAHTVAELRDLLNAYNYQQGELEKAADGARDHWVSQDAAGWTQWKADYDSWNASYQPVRTAANTLLAATATTLQNVVTAEPQYQDLAKAFAPMADLDRRFRQGPAAAVAPSYGANPQPTAPDADLGAYKATDAGTRAMPDFVKTGVATFAGGLVPQTADAKNYKPISKTAWALLALGAVVSLGVFVKVAK